MSRDAETYAPFVLFEYDHKPGTHCLMLSDSAMVDVADVFEDNGREGNGYGWADVAVQVVRTQAAELEGRFRMDPEAGTFVAFGENRDALEKLGALLHTAFHDRKRLSKLVADAPYEWD